MWAKKNVERKPHHLNPEHSALRQSSNRAPAAEKVHVRAADVIGILVDVVH